VAFTAEDPLKVQMQTLKVIEAVKQAAGSGQPVAVGL